MAHGPLHAVHQQVLASVSEKIKNFAVIYLVDISEVPDFNTMYELYDPCTVMFFFRNKVRDVMEFWNHAIQQLRFACVYTIPTQHIMIDLGTGNNNKVNWAMTDKQEFIDIVEVVYRGARKGRGLVVAPKGIVGLVCCLVLSPYPHPTQIIRPSTAIEVLFVCGGGSANM